jgi:hypothetical protein
MAKTLSYRPRLFNAQSFPPLLYLLSPLFLFKYQVGIVIVEDRIGKIIVVVWDWTVCIGCRSCVVAMWLSVRVGVLAWQKKVWHPWR